MLGFIPAKSDTVVVLLCRWVTRSKVADLQAAMCSSNQRQGYQLGYLAVVSNHTDRQFLSWLVKVPTEAEQLRARQISMVQMAKLEDLWRDNPNANLEDAEAQTGEEEMQPILLR
jgi:regulator of nonsense transcripts 1